jgi:hypothetical protein
MKKIKDLAKIADCFGAHIINIFSNLGGGERN